MFVKKKPGRPKGSKIADKDRRSFQWLNKKLDEALKKWGLLPPRRVRDMNMFDGPKRRYD